MSDGGKGSTPRPLSVPAEKFDDRWESIFGKRERKQWVYEEPKKDNDNDKDTNEG